jgi:hypothetical protein
VLVFVEAAVVFFLTVFVAVFLAALGRFAGVLAAAGVGFNAMLAAVAAAT